MKDPLFGNKLASAILVALLLIFGLPQLANGLFGGGHHGGGGELHLAYPIEFEVAPSGGAEAEPEVDLGTLLASASAAAGERRAGLCKSCHTFEEGGANGTGPNLWNIVGREVAVHPGFNYTSALKSFGGEWTYERLDAYLANSQAYVPGTAMVQRFPKDDQRADILAYLQTLSPNPVPFPEPAAPAEEEAAEAVEGEGMEGGTVEGEAADAADAPETGGEEAAVTDGNAPAEAGEAQEAAAEEVEEPSAH